MTSPSRRIEWIDLAKGFCILFVMWWHIKELYSNRGFTDRNYWLYMGTYFRMPLYFFLSGLFFKQYSGYLEFLCRKTNKLLIPYLVFAALGIAYCLLWPDKLPALRDWQSLYPFLPVWFLLCLFLMNNLFYFIQHICRGQHLTIYASVCALGVIGYYSGGNVVPILHLRSVLTAMPFFVAGYAVRQHTTWLHHRVRAWELLFAALATVALYALVRHEGKMGIFYINNDYHVPLWALYLGGALGVYAILAVANYLRRLPVVSFLGRYSIIVLITHYPIIYLFPKNWNRLLFRGFEGYCALEELVLLAFIEVPVIILCKHYLPWIFAQKDLLKYNKRPTP